MKVTILNKYFDKSLKRNIKVDEVLDLDEDRIEVLKSVGVEVKECDDDEDLHGYSETDRQLELIGAYQDDRNIVDELLAPDLKILCEAFDVSYTNVADAKESLKILTIS